MIKETHALVVFALFELAAEIKFSATGRSLRGVFKGLRDRRSSGLKWLGSLLRKWVEAIAERLPSKTDLLMGLAQAILFGLFRLEWEVRGFCDTVRWFLAGAEWTVVTSKQPACDERRTGQPA